MRSVGVDQRMFGLVLRLGLVGEWVNRRDKWAEVVRVTWKLLLPRGKQTPSIIHDLSTDQDQTHHPKSPSAGLHCCLSPGPKEQHLGPKPVPPMSFSPTQSAPRNWLAKNRANKRWEDIDSPGNLIILTSFPASTNRVCNSLTCVVLPLRSNPSSTMNAPRFDPSRTPTPDPDSDPGVDAGAGAGAASESPPSPVAVEAIMNKNKNSVD